MTSLAARLTRNLRISVPTTPDPSLAVGVERCSKLWFSTESFGCENNEVGKNGEVEEVFDHLLGDKSEAELQPQGVNPGKGWEFRGVHKAILCGKIGQPPVQKLLRNGRSLTVFTVGTGGMFDQRTLPEKGLPRPAQWHRIAVHNEAVGQYVIQNIVKNSSVYVEGDIETRVYNDNINGEVKYISEICVRRDGKVRLIRTGESVSNISLDDLREGLF